MALKRGRCGFLALLMALILFFFSAGVAGAVEREEYGAKY